MKSLTTRTTDRVTKQPTFSQTGKQVQGPTFGATNEGERAQKGNAKEMGLTDPAAQAANLKEGSSQSNVPKFAEYGAGEIAADGYGLKREGDDDTQSFTKNTVRRHG